MYKKLTGILRYVKCFTEIAHEISNLHPLDDVYRRDPNAPDRSLGREYIQGSNGTMYRVSNEEIDVLLENLPETIRTMIQTGEDIGVSFETLENPKGKYLWARNIEITNVNLLLKWAEDDRYK